MPEGTMRVAAARGSTATSLRQRQAEDSNPTRLITDRSVFETVPHPVRFTCHERRREDSNPTRLITERIRFQRSLAP